MYSGNSILMMFSGFDIRKQLDM